MVIKQNLILMLIVQLLIHFSDQFLKWKITGVEFVSNYLTYKNYVLKKRS